MHLKMEWVCHLSLSRRSAPGACRTLWRAFDATKGTTCSFAALCEMDIGHKLCRIVLVRITKGVRRAVKKLLNLGIWTYQPDPLSKSWDTQKGENGKMSKFYLAAQCKI